MVFACRRCPRSPSLKGAGEELGADLATTDELDVELGDAIDADLAERSSGEVGAELAVDLHEDHEVDEDRSSACAPYLARQMSCLGSRTPGVKDTPVLGSVWGAKEAGKRLPPGRLHLSPRSTYKQASQRNKGFTHVQAARRLTDLLLHVWIEWYIMV